MYGSTYFRKNLKLKYLCRDFDRVCPLWLLCFLKPQARTTQHKLTENIFHRSDASYT